MAGPYRRLVVVLVRPSKYDDDGYVVRHWRGTLPSNSLACLTSLTEDVIRSGDLGIDARVEGYDDTVSRIDVRALGRRYLRRATKAVVCLVGVQTNQFPRAQDLARQFKAEGFDVMIGGFHVSGAIALAGTPPPECQEMLDAGVTLVLGEVEGRWRDLLRDVLADRLQPLYDFLAVPPDLTDMPLPHAPRRAQKGSLPSHIGSIDASRGCPFTCSFCSIISVQGRTMRARSASCILEEVRRNYALRGSRRVKHYFFTDDNFSRNPQWEAIFDGLIALREEEGADVDFMMQVDTQAVRIPSFVEKAARAGCVQVFIGIESVRDDNLRAGGKPQNRSADYRDMIARWHEAGVVCHAGFIIGFPYDTYDRVMEDVRALAETMLVDQASFFMLTPIPGSRDHQAAREIGAELDPDYNNYDSFHATRPHPRMSREEWVRAFRDSWAEFYSFEHMRRSLLAQNPATYWPVFKNLIWIRAAMTEGAHPMITGFFRLKERTSRRPSFPIEARWPFLKKRARETVRTLRAYASLAAEMEQLWLLTRIRRDDYWFLGDLRSLGPRSLQTLKLKWGHLHAAIGPALAAAQERFGATATGVSATMRARIETLREAMADRPPADVIVPVLSPLPSRTTFRRRLLRLNPLSPDPLEHDPRLVAYWRRTREKVSRLQLWRLNPAAIGWNVLRGTRRMLIFLMAMQGERY
jgi:radical SAM superfamily enzyme YgiQ (UPF0313 family)